MLDIFKQYKDFKAFEIVYYNEDKQPHKILCTLQNIEDDRIVVHADIKKNHSAYARLGDDVQMNIYTELGVYSSMSKILSVEKRTTLTEYVLAYPQYSRHSQRREYFRADIAIKFEMQVTTLENRVFNITGVTKNICGNGMCYISDKSFSGYSDIKLRLLFEKKAIDIGAELVYSRPQIINNVCTKFINAFTFNEISEKDTDFIVQQCFLHQLKLRQKR
jgi:c-di-GMP-binding flagellar brake protein YcgR